MLPSSALHPFVCVWDGKDAARRAWREPGGRWGWDDEPAHLLSGSYAGVKPSSTRLCWPCWKRRPKLRLGFEGVLIESADLSELAQRLLKVRCRHGGSLSSAQPKAHGASSVTAF